MGRRDPVEVPRRRLGRARGPSRTSARSRPRRTPTRATGPTGWRCCARACRPRRSSQRLTAADDGRDHRQLGIVDAQRRQGDASPAPSCMDWAGGRTGPCFAAQGNILVGEETVDRARRRRSSRRAGKPLAERLLDVPRRGPGGRWRPPRPAIRRAPRRGARRRLRRPLRRARRPARRRPSGACRRARADLPACTTCCSARRRVSGGSTVDDELRAELASGSRHLGYTGELDEHSTDLGGHREPRGAGRRHRRRSTRSCSPELRAPMSGPSGYEVARFDELESIPVAEGLVWHPDPAPLRHHRLRDQRLHGRGGRRPRRRAPHRAATRPRGGVHRRQRAGALHPGRRRRSTRPPGRSCSSATRRSSARRSPRSPARSCSPSAASRARRTSRRRGRRCSTPSRPRARAAGTMRSRCMRRRSASSRTTPRCSTTSPAWSVAAAATRTRSSTCSRR